MVLYFFSQCLSLKKAGVWGGAVPCGAARTVTRGGPRAHSAGRGKRDPIGQPGSKQFGCFSNKKREIQAGGTCDSSDERASR